MVVIGGVIAAKIIVKLVEIGFDYAADLYFERLKKDAVYKADGVLDELDYLRLQKHVEAKTAGTKGRGHGGTEGNDQSKARGGFFSASKRKFIKFSKRVFKSDPALEKLREELLQWLKDLDESSNNVSLFSIVGHGGVAKTALAQLVYNDENLANSFNRKIWWCISTPFDVKKAMMKNSGAYRKLESIGEQIARRLGGLPLAAKTIGALLNSKLDDSHWTRILKSSHTSDDVQQRDDVMSVLMISYHHLQVHLRSCFAYCSIFPQDYMFIKDDLVFMWMALGFIQQSPPISKGDTRGYRKALL